MEELLAKTIEAAVSLKAIAPQDLERVIVDSTVQEKAIAFPHRQPAARRGPAQASADRQTLWRGAAPDLREGRPQPQAAGRWLNSTGG